VFFDPRLGSQKANLRKAEYFGSIAAEDLENGWEPKAFPAPELQQN
jgi:hypothetical protein